MASVGRLDHLREFPRVWLRSTFWSSASPHDQLITDLNYAAEMSGWPLASAQ
jgi:hypothetical protein